MAEINQQELDGIYAFAIQLGKDAGRMLMDAAQSRMQGTGDHASSSQVSYVEKENSVDLVTKTDNEVEEFIRTSISKKYPDHSFIGEETYSAGTSRDYLVTDAPTWIVDPLDGTVNFTHLFPMFCVSIAFCIAGRPVIGVIHAPFLNQLFTSCRGRGALLNETTRLPLVRKPSVPPLPADAPSGCTFSCEWGKDRRDVPGGNLLLKVDSFLTMAAEKKSKGGKGGMVHGVRSLGSATMDLAYTAMGSFDIWWEGGCWEWDVAAGIAILEEAGGLVTTANPPDDPDAPIPDVKLGGRSYLAIRPAGDAEGETGRQSQERTVREVWKRVHTLSYSRPGA